MKNSIVYSILAFLVFFNTCLLAAELDKTWYLVDKEAGCETSEDFIADTLGIEDVGNVSAEKFVSVLGEDLGGCTIEKVGATDVINHVDCKEGINFNFVQGGDSCSRIHKLFNGKKPYTDKLFVANKGKKTCSGITEIFESTAKVKFTQAVTMQFLKDNYNCKIQYQVDELRATLLSCNGIDLGVFEGKVNCETAGKLTRIKPSPKKCQSTVIFNFDASGPDSNVVLKMTPPSGVMEVSKTGNTIGFSSINGGCAAGVYSFLYSNDSTWIGTEKNMKTYSGSFSIDGKSRFCSVYPGKSTELFCSK